MGPRAASLWDEEDGFFYDAIHLPNGDQRSLKVRSMVGLIPLFAVETLEPELIARLPGFQRRMQWFLDNMPGFASRVDSSQTSPNGVRRLLSLSGQEATGARAGLHGRSRRSSSPRTASARSRSIMRSTRTSCRSNGNEYRVDYEPGESQSGLFGGNSNWRGPVWFPANFLMIESLQKFHHYYGDDFRVECPAGSGQTNVALGSQRGAFPIPDAHFPARRKWPAAVCTAPARNFRTIPCGAT